MDTVFIEQFSGDLSCFRLRTARQKKRLRYKDFDKQLRRLDKESREIGTTIRNLGWQPLEPPVQRGWKRYFAVRDDVARSKDGLFFENILAKINSVELSYRKDFLVKKRKYGRKKYVEKVQRLKQPMDWEWQKLAFTDKEKQYFQEVWEMNSSKKLVRFYEFKEPWRFVLRVRPNMIDKTKIIDTELEVREAEIDDYLESNGYNHRLRNSKGGYGNWRWRPEEKAKEKNPLANKPLYQILEEAKDDYWQYDI